MNLTPDNTITFEEFFERTQKRHEYLGFATIQNSEIDPFYFQPSLTNAIKTYFQTRVTQPDFGLTREYIAKHSEKVITRRFTYDHLLYIKAVWLTEIYRTRGFDYKMCCHWNPDVKKWQVHPGTTRVMIQQFFGPKEENFLAFNTGRKETNWQHKFTSIDDFKSYYPLYPDKVQVVLTNEHGTLIPHIHQHAEDAWTEAFFEYPRRLHEFYTTTKINANFDLRLMGYDPSIVTQTKRVLNVQIKRTKNKPYMQNVLEAFLLMPIFRNVNRKDIQIYES